MLQTSSVYQSFQQLEKIQQLEKLFLNTRGISNISRSLNW